MAVGIVVKSNAGLFIHIQENKIAEKTSCDEEDKQQDEQSYLFQLHWAAGEKRRGEKRLIQIIQSQKIKA